MDLSFFQSYLIIINVIGLVLFIINSLLYRYTYKGQIDLMVTIVSLLGGSIGVLIGTFIFYAKINKKNESIIMSRVFLYSIIPIQIILYLIISNGVFDKPIKKITDFCNSHTFLWIYLIVINVITFFGFMIDKYWANNKWKGKRISIATLLGLIFIGGTIGGYLGMKVFHHKVNKDYFTVGIPLIFIMHLVLLCFLIFR